MGFNDTITPLDSKREIIAPGTLVMLKTGGPTMVVEMRNADGAYCIWHNNEGDVFKDWFPTICLKVKA